MSKNTGGDTLKSFFDNIGDIFYPKRCVGCDGVVFGKEVYLCPSCRNIFQEVGEHYCLKCGKPISGEREYCFDCRGKETSFLYGRAVFCYDSCMRRTMKKFKYQGRPEYARYFGSVLQEHFGEEILQKKVDALVPVPIHPKRFQKRGYNQAELIAKELGKRLEIPVWEHLLIRTKDTLPQKELSGKERIENLSDAFLVSKCYRELSNPLKCVIIVDDIYTTGSTVEACARILKDHGIEKIYFFCICTGQDY